MRGIAITVALVAASLIGAGTAQAGVLTSANGTITYIANSGERNDVLVSTDLRLGVSVYTFKDLDSNPVTIGGGMCELINGIGNCRADGIGAIIVDVRDGDDTAQIATAGGGGLGPVGILSTLIGGDGVDTLWGGSARRS